ncbi:MAG: ribose transport system substrate-binding protein [Chloroflexota bacterium]|jgi:ABC-type sugar transport system substrate-binding protein|nr:ribose transport system substrate-binding protein [Chloroflexota bacterium]
MKTRTWTRPGGLPVPLVALVALVVAACGSGGASTAPTAASSAPNASSAASPAASTASRTLGIVRFSGTDTFSNGAAEGIAKYATDQGWKVIDVDAQGSVDQANAAITNLVTAGASVIYASVFPNDALQGGIAAAKAANIPVANWGGGLGDGVPIAADVGLGDAIAARVVADMGGEGELLALGYRPGLPCQRRETSLLNAVKGTNIKVTQQQITIPGQVDSALQATLGWAAAHPEGSAPKLAVWSCFDDPASGAVAALRQLSRKDVLTYGINGTPDAIALIKAGELTATLWIDGYAQGQELGKLLSEALEKGSAFTPIEIGGKTTVVDKANVDQFLAEHPELVKQ